MRRTQSLVLAGVVAVWVGLTQGHAFAHPQIDEARARIEAAEFEAALRLLAEAEASSQLNAREAADLLELRALVHLALHDRERALRTLQMLLVIDPDHVFAAQTTPDLVAAFEAARATGNHVPRLAVEYERNRCVVQVHADPLGMVRAVRLETRIDDGDWHATFADEGEIVEPGHLVACRATAVSIGGAPVFASGKQLLIQTEPGSAERRHASPWLYAGVIGGALAVGGVVLAVVLLGRSSSDTQPSAPQLVGR